MNVAKTCRGDKPKTMAMTALRATSTQATHDRFAACPWRSARGSRRRGSKLGAQVGEVLFVLEAVGVVFR